MPYWRLSSFYFFYFAILGALVPYWGLFLQNRGFDAIAIGELMAIIMATKVVAPPLWGWLGDHLGHRMMIVRFASLASVVTFLFMFEAGGFWWIALVMTLYTFFWNASLPQFEVITFIYLKSQVARYARIRIWGSVGFILAVIVLGYMVDYQGPEVVLPAVLVIFIGIWLTSLTVKDPAPEPHLEDQPSLASVLKKPAIIAFFVAVFLMQFGHGPYYSFYSIHMVDHGFSKAAVGQLWALGVIAEVILFIYMHRFLDRWGAKRVLAWSLAIAALRWLTIGFFPDSLALLLLAQVMHAATFGSFHAAAIHLIHHYFVGKHQGRGQALYSALSFGAGGALGALASGYMWEDLGPQTTFVVASAVSALGAWIVWRYIDAAHDH